MQYYITRKHTAWLFFSNALLLWLLVGSIFTINLYYLPIGFLFMVLAYYRPLAAIYTILFLLPVFGNRPSQTQVHYLVMYSSFILMGISFYFYQHQYAFKKFLARVRVNNISIFFLYLFMVVSFVSLIGLPALGMLKKTFSEDVYYIFSQLLTVGETTLYSSVQSVLLLFQSFLFGLYIYGVYYRKNKLIIFRNLILFILLGFLFSIIFGHLDFFGFYDLSWYRISDGVSIHRLHSFFVNSSWYSQYIAVTLPLLPALLLLGKNKRLVIACMVACIVIGEVTLILSMQRGAWITYPPTLLLIWISIYYVIAKMKNSDIGLSSFLSQNWIKVLVTIPLSVALSVYIVYTIKDYRKNNNISIADTFVDVNDRAKNIINTNNRLGHWPPAIKLWKENPIFGGGGDSFGWQYKVYYVEKEARFKNDTTNTLSIGQYGTAHNLYLQTLVGKGIFGLVFLVGFIFSLFYLIVKNKLLSDTSANLYQAILSISLFGSLLATMIYANVQEIFYVQSVSLIFWLVFFMALSLVSNKKHKKIRLGLEKAFKYTLYLMTLLLPFHFINIFYVKAFILSYMPFIGNNLLDSAVWVALLIAMYAIFVQKKVIDHAYVSSLFIDEDEKTNDKIHAFHKVPTPRIGGMGIYLANLFIIFNPIGWKIIALSLPAFLAGLMDDFRSISPKIRLLLQSITACLTVAVLDISVGVLGFGIELPYYLAIVVAIVAIVGTINAVNIIDGFNGLASGFSLMVLLSAGIISWQLQDMVLLEIVFINIIALLGFFIFNYPKGKIFLGDSGAYFLGFLLICLLLYATNKHSEISFWYIVSLLSYPMVEVCFSTYRRLLRHASPLSPDKIHFHQVVYRRITKSNPATSRYIWLRVLPFVAVATIFYNHDLILVCNCAVFTAYYLYLYRKMVKFHN